VPVRRDRVASCVAWNTHRPPRRISSRRSVRMNAVVLTIAGVIAAATATAQVPTGHTIEAFRDEFNGTALDTTKWNAGVINYPSG